MTTEEKFCLKWNDFQQNARLSFVELRGDRDFADVTLACEDHEIEAHKAILSASSPFFSKILRKNKHSHPLIYMRGMKATELTAIVDFIYLGEVNIYQQNLESFLTLADEIEL
jgi:hypothetical protein